MEYCLVLTEHFSHRPTFADNAVTCITVTDMYHFTAKRNVAWK